MSEDVKITPYNPAKHYWLVTADDTIWSSSVGGSVSADDAAFAAWKAAGNEPTRIGSMSELVEVWRAANIPPYHAVSTYRIVRRIEAAGKSAQAVALLDQHPNLKMRFLTLPTVPADDADAQALVLALGLDPTTILAAE